MIQLRYILVFATRPVHGPYVGSKQFQQHLSIEVCEGFLLHAFQPHLPYSLLSYPQRLFPPLIWYSESSQHCLQADLRLDDVPPPL